MQSIAYKPIDCGFHDVLEATITGRTYSHLQYFTDLWEFTTATTLLKNLVSERGPEGLAEYLVIDTGERIRLDCSRTAPWSAVSRRHPGSQRARGGGLV
jgi:Rho-binding antiterminator